MIQEARTPLYLSQSRQPSGGERDYGLGIRAVVRGLWLGVFDQFQFIDSMVGSLQRGLARAAREGAAECGIGPEEMSHQELAAMDREINNNFKRIFQFSTTIMAGSKRDGGKLGPLLRRATLWINRYDALRVEVAALACGDKKKVWRIGNTLESCRTCLGFEGRVYRYSVWVANGALPKVHALCCRGFRCDCRLEDTDAKMTPGRFPRSLLCT